MKKIIITLFFFLLSFSFTWAQSDVMITPQKMPSFIGGNDSIAKFITSELNKHPEFLSKISFSGKCYINFTIDEDGKVQNIKLIKGISNQKIMNETIIESIKKLDSWQAGEHNDSKVKVALSLTLSVKQIGSKFKVVLENH